MVKLPWLVYQQFSLDIGSSQTKIMSDGKVIWQEPTCLSINEQGQALNLGQVASVLVGKTPPGIEVVLPIASGACVDEIWLDQYLLLLKQKILQPNKLLVNRCQWQVHLPDLLRPAEAQVLTKQCHKTLGRVKMVATSQAIANLSSQKILPEHVIVISLGDQSTGLFVCHQQIITEKFLWHWGIHALIQQIEKVLTENFQVMVSDLTLSQILTQVASIHTNSRFDKSIVIQAKSSQHQTSVAQIVTSDRFRDSLLMGLEDWLLWVQHSLTQISESSHKQLLTQGIWLIGGGANLPGLSAVVSERLQCPVQVLSEPELAVVRGLNS